MPDVSSFEPKSDYMMLAVRLGGLFMVAASAIFVIVNFRRPLMAQLERLGLFNRDEPAQGEYPEPVNYQTFIPPH